MTPDQFVKNFYIERKSLVEAYLDSDEATEVSALIAELQLDEQKREKLRQVLNGTLRDAFYTILLGLDGSARLGEQQESYRIEDEDGNELSGGEIETYAWEYFHDNKFEIDHSTADFIATLTYKTPEEGGRRTPALSGYRPHLQFEFDEMQTSGQQVFIDRKLVFPGDTVDAEITILAVDHFAHKLTEGMRFTFSEGPILIGTGVIRHILNNVLKKPGSV